MLLVEDILSFCVSQPSPVKFLFSSQFYFWKGVLGVPLPRGLVPLH